MLPIASRQADHDSGEDDQRHAITHAAFGDLFAQPHDERRSGGERKDGQQHEAEPGVDHHALLHTHERLGDAEGLDDRKNNREVTGPLRDLAAAEFALLLELFKRRNDYREQLQNDGCRNVRHDAQREDGELADIAAGEQIEEPEDRSRRRAENGFPFLHVDAGRGHLASQTVYRQQAQREHEPLAQIGNAKDVRERFYKLLNHGSLPALRFASRADSLGRSAGFLDLIQCRLRKVMGLHRDLARQFAAAQNLEAIVQLFDHAELHQPGAVECVALEFFEAAQVHNSELLLKDIGKAALRKAAMQRHLAAFKPAFLAEPRDGTLALGAARGVFAGTRAHAAAHALAGFGLAGGRS